MNRSCRASSQPRSPSPRLLIATCGHILDQGGLCRAPVVSGRRYCRAHLDLQSRLWRMARARCRMRIQIPELVDLQAVHLARARVRYALAAGRIDPSDAGLFLYGLRIAASNLRFLEAQAYQLELAEEADNRLHGGP
jgi:hypothetical protein